ncbi:tripartite tricarboxylate transporter permease [Acuticoccus sp.]|uniref:tripartite tricarboxylate transporter permease n=1 Tax=Acuticoccus sp. TaxID=1904378 RepID=UPI003B52740F
MVEGLAGAFGDLAAPWPLATILIGTTLGIMVGALPGLSSPMAIIVLLPITYNMETLAAFQLMVGIYVGTKLGGSYASILLRTPGTPAAACTALDGFPMAEQGRAGEAIGYAVMASTAGGLVGWLAAVSFVPFIASLALHSEPADIALIAIAGLVMVSAFVRGSMVKGLIGVLLGLLIASVGYETQDGVERYSFGHPMLASGFSFAAVLVGFFGITVVLNDLELIGRPSQMASDKLSTRLPRFVDFLRRWRAWTIGTAYGVVVGALPGVGADGSTWLAYATVKNGSKDPPPEAFGTGVPEGILAPESSNNATTGGTMIPMLTLGIPGDASTAIMLGAMVLHGLQPGVMLMQTSADLVYGILAAIFVANIMMFVVGWNASRMFILVLRRDRSLLFPFIVVFATIGAFAAENDTFPIFVAIGCGVAGYFLEKRGFSVVTIVLGAVLGPIIEYNVRLGLAYSNGDWAVFLDTWPRMVLCIVIALLLGNEVIRALGRRATGASAPTIQQQREETT